MYHITGAVLSRVYSTRLGSVMRYFLMVSSNCASYRLWALVDCCCSIIMIVANDPVPCVNLQSKVHVMYKVRYHN